MGSGFSKKVGNEKEKPKEMSYPIIKSNKDSESGNNMSTVAYVQEYIKNNVGFSRENESKQSAPLKIQTTHSFSSFIHYIPFDKTIWAL